MTHHYISISANVSDESGGNVYAVAFSEDMDDVSNRTDIEQFSGLTLLSPSIQPSAPGVFTEVSGTLHTTYTNISSLIPNVGNVVGGDTYYIYIVVKDVHNNANVINLGAGSVVIDRTVVSDQAGSILASVDPSVVGSFVLDSSDHFRFQSDVTVYPEQSWVNSYTIATKSVLFDEASIIAMKNANILVNNNSQHVYAGPESFTGQIAYFYDALDVNTETTTLEYGELYEIYNVIEDNALRTDKVYHLGNVRAGTEPTLSDFVVFAYSLGEVVTVMTTSINDAKDEITITANIDATYVTEHNLTYYAVAFTNERSFVDVADYVNANKLTVFNDDILPETPDAEYTVVLNTVVDINDETYTVTEANNFFVYLYPVSNNTEYSTKMNTTLNTIDAKPYVTITETADATSGDLTVIKGSVFSSTADINKYYVFSFVTGTPDGTANVPEELLTTNNLSDFITNNLGPAVLSADGYKELYGVGGNIVYYEGHLNNVASRYDVLPIENIKLEYAFRTLTPTSSNDVLHINADSGWSFNSVIVAVDNSASSLYGSYIFSAGWTLVHRDVYSDYLFTSGIQNYNLENPDDFNSTFSRLGDMQAGLFDNSYKVGGSYLFRWIPYTSTDSRLLPNNEERYIQWTQESNPTNTINSVVGYDNASAYSNGIADTSLLSSGGQIMSGLSLTNGLSFGILSGGGGAWFELGPITLESSTQIIWSNNHVTYGVIPKTELWVWKGPKQL
jgi:hypothetical protein